MNQADRFTRAISSKSTALTAAATLISCIFYVVAWEVLYFNFLHGFMDNTAPI